MIDSQIENEMKNNLKEENDEICSSLAGLRPEWTRATFIIRKEQVAKIKATAYWERKKIKEVVDEALDSYLKDKRGCWERK